MPLSNDDLMAFGTDLASMTNALGVNLTHEEVERIFQQAVSTGALGTATVQHALESTLSERPDPAAADYGDDFDYEPDEPAGIADDVEEMLGRFVEPAARVVAERTGRPLTRRESSAIRGAAEEVARGGSINHDEIASRSGVKPFEEMSRTEQARVMAERFQDQQPDPDPDRVFDLDDMSSKDWNDYMVQRVQGVEFETADD